MRRHDEFLSIPPASKVEACLYPWEEGTTANLPKITKEFFRCKGSQLNPEYPIERGDKTTLLTDCDGADKHSLPIREDREFVYPILLHLLNYIQSETGKKVVITSGHRCPEHNMYVDSSHSNRYSKHMIGAEVSFYIQGMEQQPEKIVKLLFHYYHTHLSDQDKHDFLYFQRYEKKDTNVSISPWFNKEIFIKLFNKDEGRNFDNRHPYPYISIQVRYDRELDERVAYSWDNAYKNYLRH